MELKQYLKLSQQLVMTPQLQQAIKLLQLSRVELESHVQDQLLENPTLEEIPESELAQQENKELPSLQDISAEEGTNPSAAPLTQEEPAKTAETDRREPIEDYEKFVENYEEFSNSSHAPSHRLNHEERPSLEATVESMSSLHDHLRDQLRMSSFDEEDSEIAKLLIGNIGDSGYIQEEVLEDIARDCDVEVEQVEWVLEHIQGFDPLGVGSRNLQECLQVQAEHFFPDDKQLLVLIEEHLGNLEKHDYKSIQKDLKINTETLKRLMEKLGTLEPKPGRNFASEQTQYVTPDVYITKVGDEYIVHLNEDGLPKLRINNFYKSMIQKKQEASSGAKAKETSDYVQDRVRSAVWLIRSIHQRQTTIRKVTESIVRYQREFLDLGVQHLKPLILRDVADDIGMHESTVSRVTTQKYVQTPQGIFELKYFFNSRIGSVYGSDDLASEAVKSKIKKLVDGEPPQKPLSDARIVVLLKEDNIDIARRTVAKYREMLGIPSSSRRKKLL